jgi:hypothetical protein
MLLASKNHGLGNTTRWEVDYSQWLTNPSVILSALVVSSSLTLTIQASPSILGKSVVFFTVGGVLGETPTVTLTITDTYGNTKIDTINFAVVAQ